MWLLVYDSSEGARAAIAMLTAAKGGCKCRHPRNVVFAHFRHRSVTVTKGPQVKVVDPIGKTGNSGNTPMPNLHFQVQPHSELWEPDNRSLPFAFGDGPVHRK